MKLLGSLGIVTLALVSLSASALATTFVPPNDTVGSVWTTNTNDGWAAGRGITFQVASATTITSVGLYEDLTNINLSWKINDFNSQATVFGSGGGLVTTRGLQWIDYSTSLTLLPGTLYQLEFSFNGNGNQNFFYNNNNVLWSQGGFNLLDGTQAGGAGNFVVAAFRVNDSTQSVPDSAATVILLGASMLGLASFAKRARR